MDDIKIQKEYMEKVNKLQEGETKYYCILTMGCQLNENDSEKLCGMAEEMGYQKVEKFEMADLAIINTCCIRENAEDRLFGKLGELKRIKEKRNSIIAIGGCMMQENHMIEKIHKSYPYVDLIFGTHTLQRFPQDLYKVLEEKKKIKDIMDIDGDIYEGLPIKRQSNIKASVTIMNGCNNFCSYCIVPYVRGRERSRSPKDILEEIRQLAKQGYIEVTLLGQNVNSYKGDGTEGIYRFSELLRAVNKIENIRRIRFLSPHPKDFTDDVIEAIRDCDKVCKSIHLPLQSGSSSVLKAMNRKYSKEQFLELVEKMKANIPDLTLSTDIIVGFPGETEEDFLDTLDVVEKVKFEQVYMFLYSRRVGTPGDRMENQIPEDTKHERFNRLKALVDGQIKQNNEKYIDTIQDILVEGPSKNNPELYSGRTQSNKVVIFEGEDSLIDQIIPIKIQSEHVWYLKGERI